MGCGRTSIGSPIANLIPPSVERSRIAPPHRGLRRWWPPILALFLICIALALFAAVSLGGSSPDPIAQAAIAYSKGQLIWDSGPTVQSVHVVPMRALPHALAAYAPPQIGPDVNTAALIRQHGPNLRVAMVLLHGSFNSLPPGEGITLHYAVVLVNAQTKKAFFLID